MSRPPADLTGADALILASQVPANERAAAEHLAYRHLAVAGAALALLLGSLVALSAEGSRGDAGVYLVLAGVFGAFVALSEWMRRTALGVRDEAAAELERRGLSVDEVYTQHYAWMDAGDDQPEAASG